MGERRCVLHDNPCFLFTCSHEIRRLLSNGRLSLDDIKNYLIDMDGVLLLGMRPIPGAVEFVQRLRTLEIPFLIFTNNSLDQTHFC
jgi:beta-phosphoglucomutase-like phosphatase (HAD superfamily)